MRKIFVIAAREYNAAVRTKSFIISLVVMPVMMAGSIVVQTLLKDQRDTTEKHFAIVDRTPNQQLAPVVELALQQYNENGVYDSPTAEDRKQIRAKLSVERVPPGENTPEAIAQQRFELSERVRKQEIFGFLDIGADVFMAESAGLAAGVGALVNSGPGENQPAGQLDAATLAGGSTGDDRFSLRYQSNSPTFEDFSRLASATINLQVKTHRFNAMTGKGAEELAKIETPVRLDSRTLTTKNAATGEIEEPKKDSRMTAIFAPMALIMLMFMLVMVGASPLTQGVIEEKLNRIAEVLLGSVPPFQLMMGKLLGTVGVSTTLGAIYMGGLYWAADHFGFAQYVPLELLAWFFLFETLAVLMFGSMFIAVGAACTDMRESQTMLTPLMLVVMSPMFVWFNVIQDPTSTLSTMLSLFPTATPMLMIARVAIPPGIPVWQPALGVVLTLLTTVVCVWVAGRIFRVGILMQGKGANFKDLCRWVIRG